LVHIVFHAHHADVTDALQARAEQAVRKLASRLRGATDASIRFATDGATRRVEIVLAVARRKPLVAVGAASRNEGALGAALERLTAHVAHVKAERARKRRTTPPVAAESTGDQEDDFADLLLDDAPPPRRVAAS
jgi:ribosome-associated translation inhibitor RaiA